MEEQVWTKKRTILITFFGILAIGLLIYNFFFTNKSENDIEIVKSSSKFYTVSNCVYRYLTYVEAKNSDNILLLLDNKYKKDNSIDKNNVIDIIGSLDGNYSFEGRKMYEQRINDNTEKYYVYGYLRKEVMNPSLAEDPIEYYIIVTLDTKNQTFSITPYDGEIFVNGGI